MKHDHGHDHSHDLEVKKVDRLSSTQVRLTLAFSGTVLKDHEKSTARRYSQVAKIQGFRPGKAPLSMVMDRYKDEIRKDVVSHLLEAGLSEAIQKTNLVPINRPKVQVEKLGFDNGEEFEFQAEFEVQPEIELNKYKGVPLNADSDQVTDEDIQKTIDGLRDRFASLEPDTGDQPAVGAFVVAEVGFQVEGEPERKQDPKPFTVEVGTGKLLPEIDAAFLEMKVGEAKSVKATFPADYDEKTLAGKTALFDCKIVELKKKVLPDLNDTFAAMLKPGATMATLNDDVRESLTNAKKEESQRSRRQQIIDYLIRNNHFEVPASLVERQSQSLLNTMAEDVKRRGQQLTSLRDEDLKEVRESAENMVRGSLLLKEIAQKEKIELDESKLQERIESIAQQLQRSPEETEKFLSGKGMLDRLRDEILTDQVFAFLIENAQVSAGR